MFYKLQIIFQSMSGLALNMNDYELYVADIMHEYEMIKKYERIEVMIMERKIILIKDLVSDSQVEELIDYVWKGDMLIPQELLEVE